MDDKESFTYSGMLVTEDPTSRLGRLAAKVAYYNFEWRFVTLVMFNAVSAIGLNTFLKNYEQSVILKLGRFVPSHRLSVPQIVVFGESYSEISSTLRWIIRNKFDSNARYLIVCGSTKGECDELKIFQQIQSLFIINAVLLKASSRTTEPLAYMYQIAIPGKCLNNIPYKINLVTDCSNDVCFKRLYSERIANFQKCRLVMSTVEQPPFMYLHNNTKEPSGIDGDIMKLVANMLNATLSMRTPVDGPDIGHYANNNWTGSLGDIYNGRVHASVCAAPLTSYKYGNFQISFTYYSMDVVWATRLPLQKTSWEKLLDPLNIYLRIILLFMFIGIIFMNTLCKTEMWREVRRAFRIEPPRYSFFFYSWVLFLGLPILREPVKRSLLITVYTWIWFCFIVRCVYQAALMNSLKQPAYLENYKTFRDVLKDGCPYGGIASLKEYYINDHEIYNNWNVVKFSHVDNTIDNILDGASDFVIASNKEVIKHHLMKYKGMKQLQIIPEKIVNSPMVVYFKKYSPITASLNYILRVALEGGFIHRLFERYLGHERLLLRRYKSHEPEPLSMKDFAGCFVILGLGMFVASIYFAVELICGNLNDE